MRRSAVVLVVAVLLVVAAPAAADDFSLGASDPFTTTLGGAPLNAQPTSDQLAAVSAEQRLEASWQSPTADAQRLQSLAAFAGLAPAGALAAAQQNFPGVAKAKPWRGINLPADEHIISYPSDSSAKVGSSDYRGYSLIDSTYPLVTTAADGSKIPVDLSLQDAGSFYRPANSAAPLEIPKDLWSGVRFTDAGISVKPASTPALSVPQLSGASVFYPSVSTDTDFVVEPSQIGADTFFLLRSPQSTESPSLVFDLPPGDTLALARDGSGGAQVVASDGTPVATIQRPLASDALGEPVAARYQVAGNTLTVSVPHTQANVAYPVLVDPVINPLVDDQRSWSTNGSLNPYGWAFVNPYAPWFDSSFTSSWFGRGLYQWPTGGGAQYYYPYLFSMWRYRAPNASLVYRAEFDHHQASLGNDCTVPGIESGDTSITWQAQGGSHCASYGDVPYETVCVNSNCSPNGIGYGNQATFMLWTFGGTNVVGSAFLGGAAVWLHDFDPPSVATDYPTGWLDPGQLGYSGVSTHDSGLGLGFGEYWVWDADGNQVFSAARAPSCNGTAQYPCPSDWNPGFPNPITGLSDGTYSTEVDIWDVVGNESSPTPDIQLDRRAPTYSIDTSSGASTLYDGREQYLDKNAYTLTVNATDDNSALTHPADVSGIGTFSITVTDPTGNKTYTPSAGVCPWGSYDSCDYTYNINPYSLSPGYHTVTINVTDALTRGTPHSGQPASGTPSSFGFYSVLGTTTSPTGGYATGKRLVLTATAASGLGLTSAKFQYNLDKTTSPTAKCDELGANSGWTDVPTGALRDARNGTLSSNTVSLSSNKTPALTWDAASTVTTDGPLCVRAWFTGSTSGPSQAVRLRLDRSGPGSARGPVPVGPGTLDLVTGNFSYQSKDVDITAPVSDLGVTRTFNSRSPAANGNDGPLGPGWQLDLPVPEAASEYRSIDASNLSLSSQVNKGFVTLNLTDGSQVGFARSLASYVPDPGYEEFTLSHLPRAQATSRRSPTSSSKTPRAIKLTSRAPAATNSVPLAFRRRLELRRRRPTRSRCSTESPDRFANWRLSRATSRATRATTARTR